MLTLLIFINIIFIWKFKKFFFFQIKELFLHLSTFYYLLFIY